MEPTKNVCVSARVDTKGEPKHKRRCDLDSLFLTEEEEEYDEVGEYEEEKENQHSAGEEEEDYQNSLFFESLKDQS